MSTDTTTVLDEWTPDRQRSGSATADGGHERIRSRSRRMALMLVLTVGHTIALTGCSSFLGPIDRSGSTRANGGRNAAAEAQDATRSLSFYLDTMRTLIEAEEPLQADTFRNVARAADLDPTTSNQLNYALALSVPGHLGSNDAVAQQWLRTLIESADSLDADARTLATIQLHEVDRRLALELEQTELEANLTANMEAQDAAARQRIVALIDENRRLQAELDDATNRLDEIARIEQTIRELEDDAN